MARLLEYQGKQLLAEGKIPVPRGRVADSPDAAYRAAKDLGVPVAIKAQIRMGRRGKAGGVGFAETPAAAAELAATMLGGQINGVSIKQLLVEERLDIAQEYYLGIVVSGASDARSPVVLISSEGGTEIEEVAEDRIASASVDVAIGLRRYQVMNLARRAGVPPQHRMAVASVGASLYRVFERYDCRTLEINPLTVGPDGAVVAADCRAAVDHNALFRHPELGLGDSQETDSAPTPFDRVAWSIESGDLRGTGYITRLQQTIEATATIGYHGIGGGAAILGVDALNRAGLRVANYADTSGNPPAAKVYRVAKLILAQPDIDGYCVGGFVVANQEQWHHAHALVKVLREELPARPGFPVVILLCGNRERESLRILRQGLSGLPGRIRIYGREHVYDTDFIAGRMRELVDEYRSEKGR